jgi:hypothetical protein
MLAAAWALQPRLHLDHLERMIAQLDEQVEVMVPWGRRRSGEPRCQCGVKSWLVPGAFLHCH